MVSPPAFCSAENWLTIPPPPGFFVSVASKWFSVSVNGLESTLARSHGSVDSKGGYVAPKLCKMGSFWPVPNASAATISRTRRERRLRIQKTRMEPGVARPGERFGNRLQDEKPKGATQVYLKELYHMVLENQEAFGGDMTLFKRAR